MSLAEKMNSCLFIKTRAPLGGTLFSAMTFDTDDVISYIVSNKALSDSGGTESYSTLLQHCL